MKRSEEISIRSTHAVIAFSVTSTSNFSFEIYGYLLIPWSRNLLENLTGSKPVKKFLAFLGNPKLNFLKYCKHKIVISITFSSSETSYIEYTRMSSPIYLLVAHLFVSHPVRAGPGLCINVSVLSIVIC